MISRLADRKLPFAGSVDCVVIGAGHSGLAMSRRLSERSIEHVVLERGEVANSWRHERWDSLRLLTPNWLSRLPGFAYSGNDPDGFMSMPEVIEFIDEYAEVIDAPVRTNTRVERVYRDADGYRVASKNGEWQARTVVLASGAHNVPIVPPYSSAVPAPVESFTPLDYGSASDIPPGGILVVGASATGLQLAREMAMSGRRVILSVGEHVRMPRTYRGRDIQWWMDRAGILDQKYDEVDDIGRARRVPSPQLIGTPERATLDLNSLVDVGVEIVGRLAGIGDGRAQFSGSLPNHCRMADLKLGRLLDSIDGWASELASTRRLESPERFAPTRVPASPRLNLDLRRGEIGSILWATGFRPDYSWLDVPALDRKGHLVHDGGIVAVPGLYAMGLHFMRRRKSSFIHGAGDDSEDLANHLADYLGGRTRAPLLCAAG